MNKRNKEKIRMIDNKEKKVYTVFLTVVTILFVFATAVTRFNPFEIFIKQGDFWSFITQDFLPPTLQRTNTVLSAIVTTIALAVSSTFVSGIIALFFAMFGSEYISPFPEASKFIRGIATFLRNVPALVWAFILFSSLGIGTGVGFVALLISSFAFLTRAFIEVIDDVSHDAIEGLSVCGSTFLQKIFQGVIPSCIQDFLAWFLYSIEVNIRASTIVGMVGGGGIGLVLFSYIKSFKYSTAAGIILIIAFTIILIDYLTGYIRKKVLAI
jgi:phosphonate transport system permease protein